MTIKIFSLNIWNINSPLKKRMRAINSILQNFEPNLIFFQEVSPDPITSMPQTCDFFFSNKDINHQYSKTGYWKGREEGLAIASSLPMENFFCHMLPEAKNDMERQVMASIIYYKRKKILVANTHLAFAIYQENERLIQIKEALRFLEKVYDKNKCDGVILSGDFNTIPSSEVLLEVKKSSLDLYDIFENTSLRNKYYTFSSKNPFASKLLVPDRWIDYIFVSNYMNIGSLDIIFADKHGMSFSDHFALTAEIYIE